MTNPYQAPGEYDSDRSGMSPLLASSTIVKVKVLAILTIVQGALELVLGFILVGVGVVVFFAGPEMIVAQHRGRGVPPPPFLAEWLFLAYLVMGGMLVLVASLRIGAGIMNLSFRGRVFGMITAGLGLLTSLTCYCAPTSIALLIYALIVYLDGNVVQAFRERDGGMPISRW